MALNKITFDDKVALNPQPEIAEVNKVTDANINQIKNVVNATTDYVDGKCEVISINPSDYISISNSYTQAPGTPTGYKVGNLVVINIDITAGTIGNGETVIGSCTNNMEMTGWGFGRIIQAYPNTGVQPATFIGVKNGQLRIYTGMAGGRCAGQLWFVDSD